jgi:flagellar L-ring protein FlgH
MKNICRVIILGLILSSALLCNARCDTGSIPNFSLFTDQRAYKAGDLVMVNVVEQARASKSISSRAGKNSRSSFGLSGSASIPGVVSGSASANAGINGDNRYSSSDDLERKGSFTAKVTVKVVQVMPDGNLKIDGSQLISINKEKQTIHISGIIRPYDIDSNNMIYSNCIADAKIDYSGGGAETNIFGFGIFGWLFQWLM